MMYSKSSLPRNRYNTSSTTSKVIQAELKSSALLTSISWLNSKPARIKGKLSGNNIKGNKVLRILLFAEMAANKQIIEE